ncbi:hypothetical protein JCM33374_g2451 [Metschnikowia sp. JCM 33374]|nr:hypothetical protein JCM33374_g2451 [Metschnikowia sp. JCM 33374]
MSPGPTIVADENDWVCVKVVNHLQVSVSLHFHGVLQLGTPWADGVPGITQNPVASGENYTYTFQVRGQSGAFWYHSHFRGYSSDGLYGLIYVRPGPQHKRPYRQITTSEADLALIAELETNPASLIADDVFHDTSDDVFLRMFQHGVDPLCIQSIVVNGKGRVLCHRPRTFRRLAAKNPFLMKIPEFDSMGCVRDPALLDFHGVPIDHQGLFAPGYSASCEPTASPLHIHYTNHQRWQYINVLNSGGQNTKAFSIDDHPFYLIAVDGIFVHAKKVHSLLVPVGSRCTILVETAPEAHNDTSHPFAIRFAASHTPQYIEGIALLVYGKADETTNHFSQDVSDFITYTHGQRYQDLDGRLMSRSDKLCWPHETTPLEPVYQMSDIETANVTFNFFLSMFDTVQFTMFHDHAQLPKHFETAKPLLHTWYEGGHEAISQIPNPAILYPNIPRGSVVDLIINNNKHINHPMHLHGHYMHLLSHSTHENFPFTSVEDARAANCSTLNLKNPPLLDVVLVPVGGHAVLRFVADNPGIWLLHCHNIGHLMGGMGAILLEALDDIPARATAVERVINNNGEASDEKN